MDYWWLVHRNPVLFTYDAADENVIFVEVVVFTDQVIEIEGMHFHYWEDA